MTRERLDLGARGEELVAGWYLRAGYSVLERNWRCREGELDVVAARGPVLAFCEVKTRRGSAFGGPAEAVTLTKQRRLRRLAARWLAESPAARAGRRWTEIRFDVACVTPVPGGGLGVEMIEAAF